MDSLLNFGYPAPPFSGIELARIFVERSPEDLLELYSPGLVELCNDFCSLSFSSASMKVFNVFAKLWSFP